MSLPDDIESAKAVIRSLNKGKPDKNDAIVKGYNYMLGLLSNQIYGKPAHFVLELLQNADDNIYAEGTKPTLNITYEGYYDRIRLDCNEVGFDEGNVKAICDVGESTKKDLPHTTGQKGIGFKSVFKVANVAYVASGRYTFKLDKREPLGVISPEWWDVPDKVLPADKPPMNTTIILEVMDDAENSKIKEEVRAAIDDFDPNVLIFLRQLEKVQVSYWSYTRLKDPGGDGTENITIERDNKPILRYKIFEHQVRNLPSRPGYSNIEQSTIVLAFPVTVDFRDMQIMTQQVYTYLPVKSFGLYFTIQADFELTANREDIAPNDTWNETLLAAIPKAFANAIEAINTLESPLRYTWPIYLPLVRPQNFFESIGEKIEKELLDRKVLEVAEGPSKLASLNQVVHVPEEFRFCDAPLVLSKATKVKYLSPNYTESSIIHLKQIGLKDLKIAGFLDDLEEYMDKDPATRKPSALDDRERITEELATQGTECFTRQSLEWQASLATVLDKNYRELKIKDLKFIPLSNGEWDSIGPDNTNIFFSSEKESDDIPLPEGICVRLVHPSIRADAQPERRKLFATFHVQEYDLSKICRLVVVAHSTNSPPPLPKGRPLHEILFSQALFLFKSRQAFPNLNVDLWVATDTGGASHASQTYFKKFEIEGFTIPVVHSIYLNNAPSGETLAWTSWLETLLKIRHSPRLVEVTKDKVTLAREMECILCNWEPYEILELLKKHQKDYLRWISKKDADSMTYSWRTSLAHIRDRFASLEFKCQDGNVRRLSKTTLLTDKLKNIYGAQSLGLLELPQPVIPLEWYFLENFGVTVQPDIRTYISCLETLSVDSDSLGKTTLEHIMILFGRISDACQDEGDKEWLKNTVNAKALIFIPNSIPGQKPKWVSARKCVWKGPQLFQLKHLHALSDVYSRHETLFLDILEINPSVEIQDLVEEACEVSESDNVDLYIFPLLCALNDGISKLQNPNLPPNPPNDLLKSLSWCSMFPIIWFHCKEFSKTCPSRMPWFIADRQSLLDNFRGVVPLLAIDIHLLDKLGLLLHFLDDDHQFLSTVVKPHIMKMDLMPPKCEPEYSKKLGAVVRYLEYLVPNGPDPVEQLPQPAMKVKVYSSDSDSIEVTWQVKWGGHLFESLPDRRRAIATLDDHVLKVYLVAKDLSSAILPLDLTTDLMTLLGIPANHGDVVQYILAHIGADDMRGLDAELRSRKYSLPPLIENDLKEDESEDRNQSAEPDTEQQSEPGPQGKLELEMPQPETTNEPKDTKDTKITKEPDHNAEHQPEPDSQSPSRPSLDAEPELQNSEIGSKQAIEPNQIEEQWPEPGLQPQLQPNLDTERKSEKPDIESKPAVEPEPSSPPSELLEDAVNSGNTSAAIAKSIMEELSSDRPSSDTNLSRQSSAQTPPVKLIDHPRASSEYATATSNAVRGSPVDSTDDTQPNERDIIQVSEIPAAKPVAPVGSDDEDSWSTTSSPSLEVFPRSPNIYGPYADGRERPQMQFLLAPTIEMEQDEPLRLSTTLHKPSPNGSRTPETSVNPPTQSTFTDRHHVAETKSLRGDEETFTERYNMGIARAPDLGRSVPKAADEAFNSWIHSQTSRLDNLEDYTATPQQPLEYSRVSLPISTASSDVEEDPFQIRTQPPSTNDLSGFAHDTPRPTPPLRDIHLSEINRLIHPLPRHEPVDERLEHQYQIARRLERTGLFRLTGPTSIIFVSRAEDLPEIGSKGRDSQIQTVLRSRMQVFKDENRSVFALVPTLTDAGDVELTFLGQAWVSQLFTNYLRSAYRVERHWLSPLRSQLGYATFEVSIEDASKDGDVPFVIKCNEDALTSSKMTNFLAQKRYSAAEQWKQNPPDYYVDVQTTPGSLGSTFGVTSRTFEKIRECGLSKVSNPSSPEKVFILIRLVNVQAKDKEDTPKAFFFVDPWSAYTAGILHLAVDKTDSDGYTASIEEKTAKPDIVMTNPKFIEEQKTELSQTPKPSRRFKRIRRRPRPPPLPSPSQPITLPTNREFRWKSLGEQQKIRLLLLLPGSKKDEKLEGSLITYNLGSKDKKSDFPEYVAISYAWGSSLKQFPLSTTEGEIMIPASLYLGLRRLREQERPIFIWADAICINQTQEPNVRNVEKEFQIRLLSQIFKYATTVYAWLGIDSEENDSQKAMARIGQLGGLLLERRMERRNHRPFQAALGTARTIDIPEMAHPDWVAIARLLRRRWFQRIWIVQEVVLASNLVVVCGENELPWNVFFRGVKYCLREVVGHFENKITLAEEDTRKNIMDLADLRYKFEKDESAFRDSHDMFKILELCYQKETTVPRDRIFALLGLVSDIDRNEKGFQPDYELEEAELIQKFAEAFVKKGHAIELLYRARTKLKAGIDTEGAKGAKGDGSTEGKAKSLEESLPSWVPVLTGNHYPKTLSTWPGGFTAGIRNNETAAEPTGQTEENKPEYKEVSGKGVLVIRGYEIDTIAGKGVKSSLLDDIMAYLEEIFTKVNTIYDKNDSEAPTDVTKKLNEDIEHIKWRTAIGDAGQLSSQKLPAGKDPSKQVDAASAYGALVQYLVQERPQATTWKDLETQFQAAFGGKTMSRDQQLWKRLLPYLYMAIEFADMFNPAVVCWTAKRGAVGIMPAVAHPGDIVVLFPGAKVPFLLRKRIDSGDGEVGTAEKKGREVGGAEYNLVGECYIHGIMHGEVFHGPEVEAQTFLMG